MDKVILLKRLSAIKLLYRYGFELSMQSEMTSYFSILMFHDSIEMFLKLAADDRGIKVDGMSFIDYWTKIPALKKKGEMTNLNSARVFIKHKGLVPGKLEIESARVHSTDFFKENTLSIFGIEFDKISLCDLLSFEKPKEYLKVAQTAFDEGNMQLCVSELTKSFYELLYVYKESKSGWLNKSGFDFFEEVDYPSNIGLTEIDGISDIDERVEKAIRKINKNFQNFETALEVISLGLDYRKFIKFKILTPISYRMPNGEYQLQIHGEKKWTKENCQFLIDFVLDSGLKLQDFDFNFSSLDTTKPTIVFTQ